MCVCVCIYVYVYVYIYTHTHTHTLSYKCICMYSPYTNIITDYVNSYYVLATNDHPFHHIHAMHAFFSMNAYIAVICQLNNLNIACMHVAGLVNIAI